MSITAVHENEYSTLVEIWERSIGTTHNFLPVEYIQELKETLIPKVFPKLKLLCAKNDNDIILGFIGILGDNVEMLFVDDTAQGQGIGAQLLNYAINEMEVTKVDVYEQNTPCVEFYQHLGFEIIDKSPMDSMEKPYPLLHMSL